MRKLKRKGFLYTVFYSTLLLSGLTISTLLLYYNVKINERKNELVLTKDSFIEAHLNTLKNRCLVANVLNERSDYSLNFDSNNIINFKLLCSKDTNNLYFTLESCWQNKCSTKNGYIIMGAAQ